MKRNVWFGLLFGMLGSLVLLALVSAANAQGEKPPKPPDKVITVQSLTPASGGGPDTLLGTTFSYQGLLKINGQPYTGSCDIQFTLWNGDPASGGISLGTVAALPSPTGVSAGLFTTYVDFGNQFQGDYREIEPQVRCPSGSGSYQSLGVQVIYPAPYALGLRPGTTISGSAATALSAVSTSLHGTGLVGAANNGSNAWGVDGESNSGIGVRAAGGDNASTPNTALNIYGGKLTVGGSNLKPAFIYTVGIVGGGCSPLSSPLFTGDPDAMLFVTPREVTLSTPSPAKDVEVLYNAGFWYLCSPSLATGMTYNVLVINQ
jgi:hypothetical protein